MPKNNEFFDEVYQVVRLVPKGRVTTYGAIGKFLGSAKSARMVGWAMNNSHHQLPPLPAHRVVNRTGVLTGMHHFSNNNSMAELLKKEGIEVIENQIVNFKKYFWDPSENLGLQP
jgi:methylated-DNA-protein-cysteine methyltransferase-like protein